MDRREIRQGMGYRIHPGAHYRRNKMSATTYKITIYYDAIDPASIGWAYSIRSYDQYGTYLDESSGPLPQKRRHTGLRTLRRALSLICPAFPGALRQDASWSVSVMHRHGGA